ncbi:MAG: adenosylcobinamide-phosphate synthase CbiB [Crocinitomicaceae bacterium]|nr:adenosylcobinamide-phosphate synthase CbiB [Crocinitomicaceae bacterium]
MVNVLILLSSFVLDSLFGDPRKLPHLIVGFGNLISTGERILNRGDYRFVKGMILTVFLVGGVTLIGVLLIFYLNIEWLKITVGAILLFYCLANRTLIKEGFAVFRALDESLDSGRERLSWIVGRETKSLSVQQVRQATFETMSENLNDGVIAPLFFFAIFGIPGALGYKMINTLDSMIGYRSVKYEQFGKFAARLDDVVNFIPARITAGLILVTGGTFKGLLFVFREGKRHKSPNAGYPEAALAYVLDCRFGGPNYYYGELIEKPFIGYNDREIESKEIKRVAVINWVSSIIFVLLIAGILWWV